MLSVFDFNETDEVRDFCFRFTVSVTFLIFALDGRGEKSPRALFSNAPLIYLRVRGSYAFLFHLLLYDVFRSAAHFFSCFLPLNLLLLVG